MLKAKTTRGRPRMKYTKQYYCDSYLQLKTTETSGENYEPISGLKKKWERQSLVQDRSQEVWQLLLLLLLLQKKRFILFEYRFSTYYQPLNSWRGGGTWETTTPMQCLKWNSGRYLVSISHSTLLYTLHTTEILPVTGTNTIVAI